MDPRLGGGYLGLRLCRFRLWLETLFVIRHKLFRFPCSWTAVHDSKDCLLSNGIIVALCEELDQIIIRFRYHVDYVFERLGDLV